MAGTVGGARAPDKPPSSPRHGYTQVMGSAQGGVSAFRERARLEADRYGPDPWIFVRELLQNARDAGATRVRIAATERDGTSRVVCRDDGDGMTFEHARRYLFSLYASSKENDANQAGRFGVGFWSVLRFEPTIIEVRSRPRSGDAWGVRFEGGLERVTRIDGPSRHGTEIVLERPAGDGNLERRIFDAVWQNARYLHQRDDPRCALEIRVGARRANARFSLPAPTTRFRRGSLRGVVGLGPAPRVELFSKGLRVRSAACLEDLLTPAGRHTGHSRVQFPELPGGLAPQVLLEGGDLDLLLSRADARDDRRLRRLVRLAQGELERLLDRQLSLMRPRGWLGRLGETWIVALRTSPAVRVAGAAVVGALLAMGVGALLWDRVGPTGPPENPGNPADPPATTTPVTSAAYADLGPHYSGPRVDPISGRPAPVDLRYRPADTDPHFAALVFERFENDGLPVASDPAQRPEPYSGVGCDDSCLHVELPIDTDATELPIPVPTGHRLDPSRTTLDRGPVALGTDDVGRAVVVGKVPLRGILRYSSRPAPDPRRLEATSGPALPPDLQEAARATARLPVDDRIRTLTALVAERVRYDRSSAIAAAHEAARRRGEGFIDRTLAIGAGDCDIQNTLLVALVRAAGLDARLAVGYVGVAGRAHPWLHAWVEARAPGGQWRVVDASELGDGTPIATGPASGSAVVAGTPGTPAPTLPPPTVAIAPPRAGWHAAALPVGGALALFAIAVWGFGRRTRRSVSLDDSGDLSGLVQGALQKPEIFHHMPALFHRRLVPLCGGDAMSLHRARSLGASGHLFTSRRGSRLATRAGRAGAHVIDTARPEGRIVADAFGAADLDRWSEVIESSYATALTSAVDRILRRAGEDMTVRIATEVPDRVATLDVGRFGARDLAGGRRRMVAVDASLPFLSDADTRFETDPGVALFSVVDHLVDRIDLDPERRRAILAEAAAEAIEGSGG